MFKMAFRVAYRIKGRCPRHLAYNPVKDEQGRIKGECTACYELLNAYRAYLTLREGIEKFETTVQPFITPKKARGKRVDDPLPCVRFGRYVRFEWGSPKLVAWYDRRRG